MPYSAPVFIEEIKDVLKTAKPSSILDVGAGAGKYADLIKETLGENVKVTGIEPDKTWIQQFKLPEKYAVVLDTPIQVYMQMIWNVDISYDLVIFGDVLEHLKKSDGIDVLNFFAYRSKWILCLFPDKYIQNNYEDHKLESHVSVWRPEDFSFLVNKASFKDGIHMIVAEGFVK